MSFAMAAAAPVAASAVRAPAKRTSKGARNASSAPVSRSNGASFFNGGASSSAALRMRSANAPLASRASRASVVRASAVPAPVVQAADAAPAAWKGAKLKPLGFSVLAGLIIWCIPAPIGVTAKAWHLLAVFVGTIVGIITNVSREETRECKPSGKLRFCKVLCTIFVLVSFPFHPSGIPDRRRALMPYSFRSVSVPSRTRVTSPAAAISRAWSTPSRGSMVTAIRHINQKRGTALLTILK